jgi:hypothetical protein
MSQSRPSSRPGPTGYRHWPEVVEMETEVQITLLFLGAGILAYVIIPGLLVIWDRVLDYMGSY